jgi:hypothetical protein
MMSGWKENRRYATSDIGAVVRRAGPAFERLFAEDSGISGQEKSLFLEFFKLKSEAPASVSVSGWHQLVKCRGALWVTTDEDEGEGFAVQARVVYGIFGDGGPESTFLEIINPADGSRLSESVSALTRKIESLARED